MAPWCLAIINRNSSACPRSLGAACPACRSKTATCIGAHRGAPIGPALGASLLSIRTDSSLPPSARRAGPPGGTTTRPPIAGCRFGAKISHWRAITQGRRAWRARLTFAFVLAPRAPSPLAGYRIGLPPRRSAAAPPPRPSKEPLVTYSRRTGLGTGTPERGRI